LKADVRYVDPVGVEWGKLLPALVSTFLISSPEGYLILFYAQYSGRIIIEKAQNCQAFVDATKEKCADWI
jgi:hypothetical protein